MKNDENLEELKSDEPLVSVLVDMAKSQRKTISKLIKIFIIMIVCNMIIMISGIVGFFWYESQFEIITTETVETTTTQVVSGEDSEINNIEGNMYKDNAVHNEGGE